MELIKEIPNALKTVINWLWMIYIGFCDSFGIPEWSIFGLAIGIIVLFIGISKLKK